MHRPNRPWPKVPRFWGPRATLSYDDSILIENLRNCRGITSQFTLKRAEKQMFTPDSYQYINNDNTVHLGVREMQAVCINAIEEKE